MKVLGVTLVTAAIFLPCLSWAGEMTFRSVVDPTKAGLGPGVDGHLGGTVEAP